MTKRSTYFLVLAAALGLLLAACGGEQFGRGGLGRGPGLRRPEG